MGATRGTAKGEHPNYRRDRNADHIRVVLAVASYNFNCLPRWLVELSLAAIAMLRPPTDCGI